MLLKPKLKLEKITDITPEILNKFGVKALLLDVDNTMSTHHGTILTNGLLEWIDKMQKSGIKLLVLSNSKRWRIEPFAKKINLDFIALGLKPLPFGFLRGVKRLGLKRREVAIVGDQIFTDVLGGNSCGVFTLLLTPIKLEDGWSFKLRRRLEKVVFKIHKIENYKEV